MNNSEAVRSALSARYEIARELGRGGMATVYLARDLKHGRNVAVKVIDSTPAQAVGAERFLREIRTVAGLQHPHILPLHDSGEAGGLLFYVMPYVDGGTLAERIERDGPLPVDEAVRIGLQIGDALAYAHEQGFVHRDVKPANILLSGEHALLADFGVVRPLDTPESQGLTTVGLTVGTPSYMSPEQATGEAAIGPQSDVYSMGCVLYEALAGSPPHSGPTPRAILARSLTERPKPIGKIRPVGAALEEVLDRALEPSLDDRLPSARDFTVALRGATAVDATGVRIPRVRRGLSRRMRWAGAAALVVAGGLGWWAVGSGDPPAGPAATAAASLDRVVVMPFGLIGDERLSHLEQGVSNLLSTVLDGVGDLRTVDPAAVMGVVAQEGEDFASPDRARAISEKLGARRYVSGSVQELAGRLSITAALHDVTREPSEVDRWTVEGDEESDLYRMINGLSVRLLGGLGIEGTPADLRSVTTESPVALNEFLKGETALGQGDYVSAAGALQQAVAVDTTFALGWYRLAYALMFTQGASGAVAPAQRASALSDRLRERDRRLAQALLANAEADAVEAERLYQGILDEYPNDVEALFGLADLRLHYGPLRGVPMTSLGVDFDRVLYLDDDHSEALLHRPWVAGLDGDRAGLTAAVDALVALDPAGYFAPIFQTMQAVADGDAAGLASATSALADDFARLLAVTMTSTLGDLEATAGLAAEALGVGGTLPEARAWGRLVQAHHLAGLGRWREAMAVLRTAETLDAAAALEDRALLMLAPFAPVADADLEALRAELEAWDAAAVPASRSGNPWIVPHEGFHPALRLYLLGRVATRLGDTDAALAYAHELTVPDDSTAEAVIRNTLARNVRAAVAFDGEGAAAGLAELARPGLIGPEARTWERAYTSPFFSQALERFQRAEALAASGRGQAAHDALASIWMANALDLAYMAPANLERARLYDAAGESEQAAEHYRRFVELWSGADPELAPRVEAARERIRALEG